jgi:hypothetical protein
VEQVEGLLEELAEAGEDGDNPIISFYCSDGRVYGCFGSGWRKVQGAPRAKKSKFPDPSACAQLDRSLRAACAHVDRSVNANVLASVSDSESESDSGAAQGFSMPDRRRQAQAIIGGWWQADMLAVRGKSVNPDPRAVVIAGEWAVGMAQADVKTAVNKLVRDDDPFVVKRGWTLAMLPERAPGYLTGLVGKSDADRAMEEA